MNKAQAIREARKLLGKNGDVSEGEPSKYIKSRRVGVRTVFGALRIEAEGETWAEAIENLKRKKATA